MHYSQSWGCKVRLAWGKTLAADLIDGSFKVSGKFQALLTLASHSSHGDSPPTPLSQVILLHGLKELLRKKVWNALVKLIFRCQIVEKRNKHIADLYPSYVLKRPMANASQGKVRWASKPCRP